MILRWPAEGLATFAAILCLAQKQVKENASGQTARTGDLHPKSTLRVQPAAPGAHAQHRCGQS